VKIGVVGCGGMGTTHYLSLKALSEKMDIQVTALAECRNEYLEKAAGYFPEARTYTYGMDLIEQEELDAVHICLPSYLHVSHAVAAMERGMNVFVEKPVCLTEEEGERILEAEKRTGVKVMIGQVVRSFEEYRFLKEVYDSKIYGELRSIVMHRISGDATWGYRDWFHKEKESGSVVLDLHVHDVDYLRYLLGEPDRFDVRAATFENGLINQIITVYEFGDVFATVEGVWDISPSLPFESNFRAAFDDATVCFNSGDKPSLTVYRKDGEIDVPDLRPEYEGESSEAGINISNLGPYYKEIKYFLECIRDDRKIELAPLEEGVKTVRLAIQEMEAARAYVNKKRFFAVRQKIEKIN
jgi:predicted dehydrogenase